MVMRNRSSHDDNDDNDDDDDDDDDVIPSYICMRSYPGSTWMRSSDINCNNSNILSSIARISGVVYSPI